MPTIQALRRSHGMTLVELALTAGVPARTLGAIELGILPLDGDYAARLAALFGIAPALLGTDDSTTPPAAARRDYVAALRGAALTATLISGLLLNHASVPDSVPHTTHAPSESRLWQESPRQPELLVSHHQAPFADRGSTLHTRQQALATRHTAPTPAVPMILPSSTPIPAPPAPLANQARLTASQRTTVVLSLPSDGPFHQNVLAALAANGSALQHVVVPPGDTWSFNRAVGDPTLLDLAPINGVDGAGWCNLASYYVLALRPLLPHDALMFTRHIDATGFGLAALADDDAVAIWNTNGGRDEHDLVVHNTSSRVIVIDAMLVDGEVRVSAAYR